MSPIAGKGNEADTSSKNLCQEHRQAAWCSVQLNDWIARRKVTAQKNSDFENRLFFRVKEPQLLKVKLMAPVSAATEAHGLSCPGQRNCVHGLRGSCRGTRQHSSHWNACRRMSRQILQSLVTLLIGKWSQDSSVTQLRSNCVQVGKWLPF